VQHTAPAVRTTATRGSTGGIGRVPARSRRPSATPAFRRTDKTIPPRWNRPQRRPPHNGQPVERITTLFSQGSHDRIHPIWEIGEQSSGTGLPAANHTADDVMRVFSTDDIQFPHRLIHRVSERPRPLSRRDFARAISMLTRWFLPAECPSENHCRSCQGTRNERTRWRLADAVLAAPVFGDHASLSHPQAFQPRWPDIRVC